MAVAPTGGHTNAASLIGIIPSDRRSPSCCLSAAPSRMSHRNHLSCHIAVAAAAAMGTMCSRGKGRRRRRRHHIMTLGGCRSVHGCDRTKPFGMRGELADEKGSNPTQLFL